MVRYTAALAKLASTKCGMRRILKSQLSPVDYIKWAVKTGVYKGIYEADTSSNQRGGRQQRGGNFGGDQANHYMPKINPYPEEYEILTLNPPLPTKPRLSKKDLRFLEMEKKMENGASNGKLPTEKLVESYMRRYDQRVKSSSKLTDAERESAYYKKILGVSDSSSSSDMDTAMGRKSSVLNHAYDFAMKQYEVMSDNEGITEDESIQIVEQLLAKEEKDERLESRMRAQKVVEDMSKKQDENDTEKSTAQSQQKATSTSALPSSTIPSILYSKPRTIQALHIWGRRLQAVPYNQWTLGASTALDHWVAVDVLGMKEQTWNRLLDGELEADIQESRGVGSEDLIIGDKARMKDIITVRSTLFPETVIHTMEDEDELRELEEEFGHPEDAFTSAGTDAIDAEKEATERSIDELLASLGGFEDEDEDDEDNQDSQMESSDKDDDLDSRVAYMVQSLQEWRAKNDEKPFEQWDKSVKEEFNKWLTDYLSLVTTESDGEVDISATRDALLSEPSLSRESSDAFWSQVQDEADAEILLHSLHEKGSQATEGESEAEKKSREELEVFLSLPYEKQLRQLVSLGTMRPILDEYYKESDRMKFMDRFGETLLEGMEIEHLVSDPDGNISMEDVGKDFLMKKDNIDANAKFSIKKVLYGTDEYGMTRSERARMLFRAWNMHKAGRARYAESQFKRGKMPLKRN